ncbi:MAG: hypothetical protein IT427_06230 [Pirellulales bacterium]|nr:hypothetical protein [Pirellulales bacterium]
MKWAGKDRVEIAASSERTVAIVKVVTLMLSEMAIEIGQVLMAEDAVESVALLRTAALAATAKNRSGSVANSANGCVDSLHFEMAVVAMIPICRALVTTVIRDLTWRTMMIKMMAHTVERARKRTAILADAAE